MVPFTPTGLDVRGTAPAFYLANHPMTLSLSPENVPPGFSLDEAVKLDVEAFSPKRIRSGMNGYRARLPDASTTAAKGSRHPKMQVLYQGKPIPFTTAKLHQATTDGWRLNAPHVVINLREQADLDAFTLIDPSGTDHLNRLNPARSGLTPEAFVQYECNLNDETRQGLLLPAPSSAEWSLTLPDGKVTFEAWLQLERGPVSARRTDGATAILSIVDGDVATEIGRQVILPSAKTYEQWRVDLSAHAGKTVKLRVSTSPEGAPGFGVAPTNWHDYVFVGSPSIWGPATGDVRRVIVVGLDTTRPDAVSYNGYRVNVTPELDAIARQSAVFKYAWTPAPRTRPSFRAATTGRYPLEAVGAKNIAEVFRDNGFATAGFVANVHLQPRFDFNHGFDVWDFNGRAQADSQVDKALAYFKRYNDRDTYMFLHIMDPHIPYNAPGTWKNKFVTDVDPDLPGVFNRGTVYNWMTRGEIDDTRKSHIRGLYDGEMAYMSHEIGRFVRELDKLPGKTLIVFHSDHGEEFWDHGGFEHNHTLYDDVTRALLWVRPPGGLPRDYVIEQPATLADIGPTLYDLLKFTDLPPVDGASLAPLLHGEGEGDATMDRPIGIAHIRYGVEQWGVVHNGHKYAIFTGTGEEHLYKMHPDKVETDDLAASTNAPPVDLAPYRLALAKAHPGLLVAPGWRVSVKLTGTEPLTIRLPAPALSAGIIDPEAMLTNRANLAWGEPPRRAAESVGIVSTSDDGLSVTLTPGFAPDGVLYIVFKDAQLAEGYTAQRGDTALSFTNNIGVKPGTRVTISDGTVIAPPPGEAARMAALSSGSDSADAGAENTALLCSLGYLEGPACEGVDDGHGH